MLAERTLAVALAAIGADLVLDQRPGFKQFGHRSLRDRAAIGEMHALFRARDFLVDLVQVRLELLEG